MICCGVSKTADPSPSRVTLRETAPVGMTIHWRIAGDTCKLRVLHSTFGYRSG
jgi:hypothetical protein